MSACGVDDFVHDLSSPQDDLEIGECPIDRETDCLSGHEDCEGYPSEGPSGWGYQVGKRFENVRLKDCDENERELAELLSADDGPFCDGYAGAVVIDVGAEWCDSCEAEAKALVDGYEHWLEQGVRIVNVLVGVKAWEGGSPELCDEWPDDEGVPFPVWFVDKENAERLQQFSAELPLRVFVDANANIRDIFVGATADPVAAIDERVQPVLADPFWTDED